MVTENTTAKVPKVVNEISTEEFSVADILGEFGRSSETIKPEG